MAGVDFFAHGGLPVPQVTIQDAERAAASFGLTVRAQPLGSQQDSNFLLVDPAGAVAGVLKIANPAFSAAEIEAQDGAAAHIAGAYEDLRVATATHGPVTVPVDGGPPWPGCCATCPAGRSRARGATCRRGWSRAWARWPGRLELPAGLTVRGGGNRVHVSLLAPDAPEVPALVRPEYAAGWLSLVADPGPLLGLPAAVAPGRDDLLVRRAASFAAVQEHYYRDPPRIERGWRQHLAATDGRVYLDMVNNPPAAFLAEPFYGNAGGMPLPDGYLAAVYAEVRRHGGLAIADEVQVGYGRLGHWFWGSSPRAISPRGSATRATSSPPPAAARSPASSG